LKFVQICRIHAIFKVFPIGPQLFINIIVFRKSKSIKNVIPFTYTFMGKNWPLFNILLWKFLLQCVFRFLIFNLIISFAKTWKMFYVKHFSNFNKINKVFMKYLYYTWAAFSLVKFIINLIFYIKISISDLFHN